MDFLKVETPADWPQACVCGSQKPPFVATGISFRAGAGDNVETAGHVYLCRLCVTRAARCLGLVKGAEHERLEQADLALTQAEHEMAERDRLIEKLTRSLAEREQKISGQQSYIETLTSDVTQMRHLAGLVASTAKEMVAV